MGPIAGGHFASSHDVIQSLAFATSLRRASACLVLVCATALSSQACSSSTAANGASDAGASGDAATTPAPCAVPSSAPVCDPPLDVATADDVLAKIAMLAEVSDTTVMPSSGAALLPSGDLRVTASIELDITKLRAQAPLCKPTDAGVLSDCNESMFAPEKPFHTSQSALHGDPEERRLGTTYPPGVACVAPSPKPGDGCDRLSIAAGSVLRFQRVAETFFYGGRLDNHYVRVARACGAPCAADEARCAASKTCLTAGKDYCVLCDGLAPDVCACRDSCAAKADGTACLYWSSDDTLGGRTCASGTCGN